MPKKRGLPNEKVQLTLLSGKKTQDFAALAKLFTHLTGRDPSPEELDRAEKRRSIPKRPRDMNELAVHIGKIATHEIEDVTPAVNPASKRGDARAAKLSPARRKEIAQKAARTRWGKKG